MRRLLITLLISTPLVGCASYGDYYASIDAANARQVESQRAQSEADAIRYQALMRIAESGDATAKVAATMALALGGQSRHVQMAVPAQPQNEALQWASVLAPVAMQGLTLHYNTRLGLRQSDNATALGINTNATFGQFASEIAKPPLVVTQPTPIIVEQPAPIIVDPVVVEPVVIQPE